MGTSLAVIDRELTNRLPIFQQVLPPSVSPQRLLRTVVVSCERTPKLLECSPQSIMNAATTAAVLGLECDGVTGQGFLVPYGGVATFQVGYKGYNTLAARAGYTINGGVVREGDEFDYQEGTGGFVRHKKLLGSPLRRRIIAAWATAESIGRPNIVVVMPIEEVELIKAKSAGAKKKDSPWNDLNGPGYPAMVEKTAKRRLARSMPLSVMQQAAALEDAHDLGHPAHLDRAGEMKIVGSSSVAPSATGPINDRQPDDILSPANGGSDDDGGYRDESMESPPIVFPVCRTPRDFKAYSEPFLRSATPAEARAWEENYRDLIGNMKQSSHASVREAADDLLAMFVGITAHAQEAA